MRFVFEDSDFDPPSDRRSLVGTVVAHKGQNEHFIIGYNAGGRSAEPRYHVVSLRDGMITPGHPLTAEEMATYLNNGEYAPIVNRWSAETSRPNDPLPLPKANL